MLMMMIYDIFDRVSSGYKMWGENWSFTLANSRIVNGEEVFLTDELDKAYKEWIPHAEVNIVHMYTLENDECYMYSYDVQWIEEGRYYSFFFSTVTLK